MKLPDNKFAYTHFTEPWAMTEDALECMLLHLPTNADQPQTTADYFAEKPLNNIKSDIKNNIAIISIRDALYIYDYSYIQANIQKALTHPDVKAIVLKINSPGGTVSGCNELADFIYNAKKQKNIYAYADGTMCSAAYWIGSATKHIAAPITANIGSIGVRTMHIDWSKWNEKAGLKFTHLAAGAYKTLGNEDEPLSKQAKDVFQDRLDQLYSIFVNSVARNRKVNTQKALSMADGQVFLAEQAKEKGLIDRITQDFSTYFNFILKKEKLMDLTSLKNDHKDLYDQVKALGIKEGVAQATTDAEKAQEQLSAATTDKILGIATIIAGEKISNKIKTIIDTGATVDVVKALQSSFQADNADNANADNANADNASRQAILTGLENAHSDGVNQQTGTANKANQTVEEEAKSYSDLVA